MPLPCISDVSSVSVSLHVLFVVLISSAHFIVRSAQFVVDVSAEIVRPQSQCRAWCTEALFVCVLVVQVCVHVRAHVCM